MRKPTPEEEAQVKEEMTERLRQRSGDDYLEKNAKFLELEWEWIKQLGFLDVEEDPTS